MTLRVNSSSNIAPSTLEELDAPEQKSEDPNTVMPAPTPEEAKRQREAKGQLASDISSGKAEYVKTGVIADLIAAVLNQNKRVGNYVKITNIEKGTPYTEIMNKYNLPAGALNHMVTGGIGTNKNNYGYVTIYIEDLTTALGMTENQIKQMFK